MLFRVVLLLTVGFSLISISEQRSVPFTDWELANAIDEYDGQGQLAYRNMCSPSAWDGRCYRSYVCGRTISATQRCFNDPLV